MANHTGPFYQDYTIFSAQEATEWRAWLLDTFTGFTSVRLGVWPAAPLLVAWPDGDVSAIACAAEVAYGVLPFVCGRQHRATEGGRHEA